MMSFSSGMDATMYRPRCVTLILALLFCVFSCGAQETLSIEDDQRYIMSMLISVDMHL